MTRHAFRRLALTVAGFVCAPLASAQADGSPSPPIDWMEGCWQSDADGARAGEDLRIAPLFKGIRGQAPLDLAAVTRAAQSVAALLCDPAANIASVEVNPLMVSEDGAWALDALIEVYE